MVSRVRQRDRSTDSVEEYGLARIVVAVRVAVVSSIGVLLAIGPDWIRQHAGLAFAVLAAAMLYSVVLLANARLEVIDDSGHMTPLEKPAEVSAALRRWLTQ